MQNLELRNKIPLQIQKTFPELEQQLPFFSNEMQSDVSAKSEQHGHPPCTELYISLIDNIIK